MERNLLEKEIRALCNETSSFTTLQWAPAADAEHIVYPVGKYSGSLKELSYLRKDDLKAKQIVGREPLYYPNKQLVNILEEKDGWLLVEGGATYKNGIEQNIKGWVKKSWISHKIPPRKMDEEPASGQAAINGYTCYVEIDLRIFETSYVCGQVKDEVTNEVKNKYCNVAAPPDKMTAIYIPNNFKATSETDLIIYLHGHLQDSPGLKPPQVKGGKFLTKNIKEYLNHSPESYFDFRKIINASSKKNVIFVAPTLSPASKFGNLAGDFDGFIEQVIAAINEYIFKERQLKGEFILGKIILSAHSGGGSGMLTIALSKSIYAKSVKTFWGFDSWYGDKTENYWNAIAKKSGVKIYAYSFSSTHLPTPKQDKVMVVKRDEIKGKNLNHFTLLPHYFKERLDSL